MDVTQLWLGELSWGLFVASRDGLPFFRDNCWPHDSCSICPASKSNFQRNCLPPIILLGMEIKALLVKPPFIWRFLFTMWGGLRAELGSAALRGWVVGELMTGKNSQSTFGLICAAQDLQEVIEGLRDWLPSPCPPPVHLQDV